MYKVLIFNNFHSFLHMLLFPSFYFHIFHSTFSQVFYFLYYYSCKLKDFVFRYFNFSYCPVLKKTKRSSQAFFVCLICCLTKKKKNSGSENINIIETVVSFNPHFSFYFFPKRFFLFASDYLR